MLTLMQFVCLNSSWRK